MWYKNAINTTNDCRQNDRFGFQQFLEIRWTIELFFSVGDERYSLNKVVSSIYLTQSCLEEYSSNRGRRYT